MESIHIDIEIDPKIAEKEIRSKILKLIRQWKDEDVVFETSAIDPSKGVVNTMLKCYNSKDENDAVMFRIHNANMSKFITDRDDEAKHIKLLQPMGCAPCILATFKNGFCYKFIVGEVLNHLRIREDPIWRLIATDLAKFHSVIRETDKEPMLWNGFKSLLTMYPNQFADKKLNKQFKSQLISKDELLSELEPLMKECKELNSPTVLCHIDTRGENIIYNEKNGTISFVDFENMDYHPQAAELAHHFGKFCGVDPPDYTLMPSEEFKFHWLRFYLDKYYEFTGRNPNDVTDKQVQELYVQVSKYHLLLLLISALYGPVIMANNPNHPVNMIEYAVISIREYRREKERILSLKMPT